MELLATSAVEDIVHYSYPAGQEGAVVVAEVVDLLLKCTGSSSLRLAVAAGVVLVVVPGFDERCSRNSLLTSSQVEDEPRRSVGELCTAPVATGEAEPEADEMEDTPAAAVVVVLGRSHNSFLRADEIREEAVAAEVQ